MRITCTRCTAIISAILTIATTTLNSYTVTAFTPQSLDTTLRGSKNIIRYKSLNLHQRGSELFHFQILPLIILHRCGTNMMYTVVRYTQFELHNNYQYHHIEDMYTNNIAYYGNN